MVWGIIKEDYIKYESASNDPRSRGQGRLEEILRGKGSDL